MRSLRLISVIVISSILSCCGYNSFNDLEKLDNFNILPNADISLLHDVKEGNQAIEMFNVVIAGYVTANDYEGNFYRTVVIEDHTGAIEIKMGSYDLHRRFPLGRYVTVFTKGLAIGQYLGVYQIGLPPTSPDVYQTDYFGSSVVAEKYVVAGDKVQEKEPAEIAISDITDEMCGRLVTVKNVVLKSAGEEEAALENNMVLYEASEFRSGFEVPDITWANTSDRYSAYRDFVDRDMNEISVYTSGYATFAGSGVPKTEINLTGILMRRSANKYMIKLRSLDDVEIH